jgi:hypothetical protein
MARVCILTRRASGTVLHRPVVRSVRRAGMYATGKPPTHPAPPFFCAQVSFAQRAARHAPCTKGMPRQRRYLVKRRQLRGWPVSRVLSGGPLLRPRPVDDHSSARPVTRGVKLPTRASGLKCPCGCIRGRTPRPARTRPLFGIAPGGACHTVPVARPVVGSYSTVSPSPYM